ncbi:Uu.00g031610.m01.CDS01 [Anthostomella pinea]|uniref:Uu.00g031610.m01.CDS01 n=1 Tax=Anthostomella pinea TaxID=933095 RepID=A0AAI8V8K2_9PEZI|nr:Uu.00g031610.m01.CDS01 [Anthostomella pinea]
MAAVPGSDKTLLERLNALKPSTVSLGPSSKSVPTSTIEPAKPLCREDALTERLKSLRIQASDTQVPTTSASGVHRGHGDATPSPPVSQSARPQPRGKDADTDLGATSITSTHQADDEVDPLYTDDQTLEKLLADLESDQSWLDEVAAEEDEHQRVTALLVELGKASNGPDHDQQDQSTSKVKPDDSDESSDDDSEGDTMTREADDVLAQATDETEYEKANEPPSPKPTSSPPIGETKPRPRSVLPNKPRAAKDTSSNDPFNLPTVPSDLQDQPDLPGSSQEDSDFAASIASRMAALKVSTPPSPNLPSAPSSEVDTLGLPGVPTFAPADRPAPGLVKRHGYTDEDQKTWCVVCLEDGAVRCHGCDGDVYCARCWKEMHVGPSAGYEERGHRWETFVRGR